MAALKIKQNCDIRWNLGAKFMPADVLLWYESVLQRKITQCCMVRFFAKYFVSRFRLISKI